jgi:hypothetical protein
VLTIVVFSQDDWNHHQLHANQLEASALKATDNLAYQTTLNTVWLDRYESSFY